MRMGGKKTADIWKKYISIKGFLFGTIFVILSVIFILLQPEQFREPFVNPDAWSMENATEQSLEAPGIQQEFIPLYGYLQEIKILIKAKNEVPDQGIILFELFDKDGECIISKEIGCEDIFFGDYNTIEIKQKLKKSSVYSYTLTATGMKENTIPVVGLSFHDNSEEIPVKLDEKDMQVCTVFEYEYINTRFIVFIMALALALLLLATIKYSLKENPFMELGILAASVFSYAIIEFMDGIVILKVKPQVWLVNILCFFVIYSILCTLYNNYRIMLIAGSVLFFLTGLVEFYVIAFRGTPILPWDIKSIGTAIQVGDNYNFSITKYVWCCFLALMIFCLLIWKCNFKRFHLKAHGIISAVNLCIGIVICMTFQNLADTIGIAPNTWDQRYSYAQNGFAASFGMNLRYVMIEKPSGYSPEKTVEIVAGVVEAAESQTYTEPNIIAIMSESLADFSAINELNINEDYMPFLHGLEKNTIKGNLHVSVLGGKTCNTEYEFLTGNTMAFLPSGSLVYQQYINDETDTISTLLKSKGYTSYFMHPFYEQSWNRNRIIPMLGFENRIYVDDMENLGLLRNYVSDEYNYEQIIQLYEGKKDEEKLFVFNITMQNHGPYDWPNVGVEDEIKILDSDEFPMAEQYMTIVKESDRATKQLIEYFSLQEEPTVILIFGDHLPNVEEEFYEYLFNKKRDEMTLEDTMKKYITPFYIWANYDIEEEYYDAVSSNYLSTILLEAAGIEGTTYNKFLKELMDEIPVITALAVMDKDHNIHDLKDKSVYEDYINKYHILQYNNMFGKDKRQSVVFGSDK